MLKESRYGLSASCPKEPIFCWSRALIFSKSVSDSSNPRTANSSPPQAGNEVGCPEGMIQDVGQIPQRPVSLFVPQGVVD